MNSSSSLPVFPFLRTPEMAHDNNGMLDHLVDHLATSASSPTGFIIISICLAAIVTRLVSGSRTASTNQSDGSWTIPAVPYWIPLLGHLGQISFNKARFSQRLRDQFTNGIFALNLGGVRHNILYTPGLVTALLNQPTSIADAEELSQRMMTHTFGFPKDELHKYQAALEDFMTCYKPLLTEPGLGDMTESTSKRVKALLKNFVTGNEDVGKQMPWERSSQPRKVSNPDTGETTVEASMMPLVRTFSAYMANTCVMGSDLLENFPNFFDDIWIVGRAFMMLFGGLPRWLPYPPSRVAFAAQDRTLARLTEFHQAMDAEAKGQSPGPKWRSLHNVGAVVKARMAVYEKYGFSIRARAACEHSLNWAANANAAALVFWMLHHIYADPDLLESLREEIAPFVIISSTTGDVENIDKDGLINQCPLLKSCYIETLRLESTIWSLKVVQKDFTLKSREKGSPGWQLKKGDFCHAAHDLHMTDSRHYKDPTVWKADRHISWDPDTKTNVANMGTIRPYGGGMNMCKGRAFAYRECMLFAAGILAYWDMRPADGGEWKTPNSIPSTGVDVTDDDIRVCITRRV